MKLAAALVLALSLPACAAVSAAPAYSPVAPAWPEGGSTTSKTGGEEPWYSGSPTGKKEYGRHGGYGAVGVTKGFEQFDTGGSGLNADDSDLGITIRGGFRNEDGLAFEGCIDSVTGYSVDAGGPVSVDLDMASFSFRGKYYLGKQQVQPYAFVGAGYSWVDVDFPGIDDDGGIFVAVGAGVDVYITLDVGVFLEASYNRTTGDIKDLDHVDVSGGLIFRF